MYKYIHIPSLKKRGLLLVVVIVVVLLSRLKSGVYAKCTGGWKLRGRSWRFCALGDDVVEFYPESKKTKKGVSETELFIHNTNGISTNQ